MRILRNVAIGILVVGFCLSVVLFAIYYGFTAEPYTTTMKGKPLAKARPAIQQTIDKQPVDQTKPEKQILFGDLHVHTGISLDAFQFAMPLASGEGVHSVNDAGDFARYCSGIDFWSINDHAETTTPNFWQLTKEAIRECNAVTDPDNPDVVAFLGFEWTQAGDVAENHYGHKNVIFLETDDDKTPPNPIAAVNLVQNERDFLPGIDSRALLPLVDFKNLPLYLDFNKYLNEVAAFPGCGDTGPFSEIPKDCIPSVVTPADLFGLLNQWGGESLVIPHGNTWGNYTPPNVSWDKQLRNGNHDPERQRLIELFSGHGSTEEYRDWRHVNIDKDGNLTCPEPSDNFMPGCRQAAKIIRKRCLKEGLPKEECEQRAQKAMQDHMESNTIYSFMSIPADKMEEWEGAEQCADCYMPSYYYRPGGSAQYALAVRNFDEEGAPKGFNFGFIASSDNHSSRPGTGYKEYNRKYITDFSGFNIDLMARVGFKVENESPRAESRIWQAINQRETNRGAVKMFERQTSYMYTGGLVAVHSESRTRDSIWKALKQREVYGTSGERTLLWFDMINDSQKSSMGAMVSRISAPLFQVRAIGAFKQKPGCPDIVVNNMSLEKINRLCRGECYNPSDERKLITRIEVIRIRPQAYENEPIGDLVEDPWKVFNCPGDPAGCIVEFSDPEFETARRDTLYYVRAVSEPKPTINGQQLNIQYDENGKFQGMTTCLSNTDEDCLAEQEPRAWSSPIFVYYGQEGS
ncbi:MAG: DUF3604 domain-containing protein [Desulfobacula sp.]|uniref:DUF3604 domain-containing protein n=1 Tax=Desulfobacula sp. TaxID=2593537 RepID=UPI0025BE77F7|nr:DUF3604 domain-containing protein [Desulfobacula sp.]MCD4722693.1 DUF3604 domain-containing protein [Desulfobacula sp.]